jgi:hypothetical protein
VPVHHTSERFRRPHVSVEAKTVQSRSRRSTGQAGPTERRPSGTARPGTPAAGGPPIKGDTPPGGQHVARHVAVWAGDSSSRGGVAHQVRPRREGPLEPVPREDGRRGSDPGDPASPPRRGGGRPERPQSSASRPRRADSTCGVSAFGGGTSQSPASNPARSRSAGAYATTRCFHCPPMSSRTHLEGLRGDGQRDTIRSPNRAHRTRGPSLLASAATIALLMWSMPARTLAPSGNQPIIARPPETLPMRMSVLHLMTGRQGETGVDLPPCCCSPSLRRVNTVMGVLAGAAAGGVMWFAVGSLGVNRLPRPVTFALVGGALGGWIGSRTPRDCK